MVRAFFVCFGVHRLRSSVFYATFYNSQIPYNYTGKPFDKALRCQSVHYSPHLCTLTDKNILEIHEKLNNRFEKILTLKLQNKAFIQKIVFLCYPVAW